MELEVHKPVILSKKKTMTGKKLIKFLLKSGMAPRCADLQFIFLICISVSLHSPSESYQT